MQSGNVGNGDRSAIQTTVTGPSTVSFWWRNVDPETPGRVRFYVDSVNLANASGNSPWTQVTTNITSGAHTLKWEYSNDAAIAGNQALVLLDQVQRSRSSPSRAPSGLTATVSSSIRLAWSAPLSTGGRHCLATGYYCGRPRERNRSWAWGRLHNNLHRYQRHRGQNYFIRSPPRTPPANPPWSNEVVGRIPVAVPSPPSSMAASVGPTSSTSLTSSGANVTGFHVYRGTVRERRVADTA